MPTSATIGGAQNPRTVGACEQYLAARDAWRRGETGHGAYGLIDPGGIPAVPVVSAVENTARGATSDQQAIDPNQSGCAQREAQAKRSPALCVPLPDTSFGCQPYLPRCAQGDAGHCSSRSDRATAPPVIARCRF